MFTLKVEFLTLYILHHDSAAMNGHFRCECFKGKQCKKAKIKPFSAAAARSPTMMAEV